jgi:hypothetical protein
MPKYRVELIQTTIGFADGYAIRSDEEQSDAELAKRRLYSSREEAQKIVDELNAKGAKAP